MNNNAIRRCLCLLALVIGPMAGGLAQAQTVTSYPVTATCSSVGQLCNVIANVPVTTTGLLQAQFSVNLTACSNVRIHFLVDGTELGATGFVTPGGSSVTVNLGPVSTGAHVLGLQAEGQVGGCNAGTLVSWAGTALVTTGATAVTMQPVPTLSEWTLILLVALLAIVGIARTRSRSKPTL